MSTTSLEGEDSEAALVVSEALWTRDADLEAQVKEQKVLCLAGICEFSTSTKLVMRSVIIITTS